MPPCIGRKTLILDLDETLVHSSFKPTPRPEIIVQLNLDGRMHSLYVGKRPGVDMFLAQVAEKFEVVIFTASLAIVLPNQYANPLIDKLDISSVVSYRLFRESCVMARGCYVKDLSNIGRDLSQVLLVDVRTTQNSPTSYSF
jgi:RNA polymerase II subunit A small phosphatase-like protein